MPTSSRKGGKGEGEGVSKTASTLATSTGSVAGVASSTGSVSGVAAPSGSVSGVDVSTSKPTGSPIPSVKPGAAAGKLEWGIGALVSVALGVVAFL